ncbi:MAG TPA: DUF6416 domain-containing protein [Chloroflexota bacterium]|nr:DUF6416 domain-containing protein [Chloroflexota bacterium]
MQSFRFELAAPGAALVLTHDAVQRLVIELRSWGFLADDDVDRNATVPANESAPLAVPAAGTKRIVLAPGDPRWERHSGGQKWHSGPNWMKGDEVLAERTYANISAKVRQFSDLLMDHPGEVFTVPDIINELPHVYTSDRSIAGSLNGYRLACEAAGRQFPFRWWEANPTEYAMHPAVAEVWREGRRLWQGRKHQ